MNAFPFPPLPAPTRIAVVRAEWRPEPLLEVQVAAAVGRSGAWLSYLSVGATGVWFWGACMLYAVRLWTQGETAVAAVAAGWSGAMLLGTGLIFWLMVDPTTRLGLTATAEDLTIERIWFGRWKTATLRFPTAAPGDEDPGRGGPIVQP